MTLSNYRDVAGFRREVASQVYYTPAGICPGCGADSHPGLTCDGRTTHDVIAAAWPDVKVELTESEKRLLDGNR